MGERRQMTEMPSSDDESAAATVDDSSIASSAKDAISIHGFVFDFFALSYADRMQPLVSLQLLDGTDTGISDSELVKRVIQRARDRKQLLQLEGAIRAVIAKNI